MRADRQRHSVSDALKRRELLEDFMYWFYESFILPLLKVCPNGCPDSRIDAGLGDFLCNGLGGVQEPDLILSP